jgi:hypothetical protein
VPSFDHNRRLTLRILGNTKRHSAGNLGFDCATTFRGFDHSSGMTYRQIGAGCRQFPSKTWFGDALSALSTGRVRKTLTVATRLVASLVAF